MNGSIDHIVFGCDDKERNNKTLEETVNDELDRVGQGGRWVWALFLLGTLPNILNGFHVSSYVFLGKMPDAYWCEIPELVNANWTREQQTSISSIGPSSDSCSILNYNYTHLSSLKFDEALLYTRTLERPSAVSCLGSNRSHFRYDIDGSSIVSEWDLVCENSILRTSVQVAVSIGKSIGALATGILSDKFGRRSAFAYGSILFTAASIFSTYSPWYWLFLVSRFLLGLAAMGMFYPCVIMMTENVAIKHRYWMGIAFTMAYPLGLFYLALSASFLNYWRDFQLSLTIPAVSIIFFWRYLKESPRWLLSKGRTAEAYEIVFKRKVPRTDFLSTVILTNPEKKETEMPQGEETKSFWKRIKEVFKEFGKLYGKSRHRRIALICHFAYFAASFSYYATAINADNLASSRIAYISITGGVDMLGYIATIILLRYLGRKWACFLYFGIAGINMLIMLAIPIESTTWLVLVSMFGRFGISSVYAIVTLYTSELFPTEIRNTAVGCSSTIGHMGSVAAPFTVDLLGRIAWFIPTTMCGVILFTAAILILLNPETSQSKLKDHADNDTDD